MSHMLRVCLTGGIATGKSEVLEMFRRRGIPCLDADSIAHGVTAAGTDATAAIAGRFGAGILDGNGAVDREKLGPIVFADASARRDLEAIVHPGVYRAIRSGLRGFELTGEYSFAVVDVPLLFETGHEKDFDRIIVTVCRRETQMARLMDRGMSRQAASERLAAQWTSEDKAALADLVIRTDGSLEDTDRQVGEAFTVLQEATERQRSTPS
jgi:dephospho-CoA kinase